MRPGPTLHPPLNLRTPGGSAHSAQQCPKARVVPEARPTRLACSLPLSPPTHTCCGQTQHLLIQQRLLASPSSHQQGINLNPSLQMGRLRPTGELSQTHTRARHPRPSLLGPHICAHAFSSAFPAPFHHLSHNSFSSSSLQSCASHSALAHGRSRAPGPPL